MKMPNFEKWFPFLKKFRVFLDKQEDRFPLIKKTRSLMKKHGVEYFKVKFAGWLFYFLSIGFFFSFRKPVNAAMWRSILFLSSMIAKLPMVSWVISLLVRRRKD